MWKRKCMQTVKLLSKLSLQLTMHVLKELDTMFQNGGPIHFSGTWSKLTYCQCPTCMNCINIIY